MGRIAGVFNTDNAGARMIRALEALNIREGAGFWICTEHTDFYVQDLQELRQRAPLMRDTTQCLACSSCSPFLSREGSKNRFVADAEIYNLDEIKTRYQVEGARSSDVLADLLDKGLLDARVDGSYAYAYWSRDAPQGADVYVARDILGLSPICFAHTDGFAFASEKKALEAMGYSYAIELDPRILLRYDLEDDRLVFVRRAFFEAVPAITDAKEEIQDALLGLLRASITRRIPRDGKFGVLFSGGLDSTLIAYLCRELGADFVCYTVAVADPEMKEAEDGVYARSIASDLGLALRIKRIGVEDIERYLAAIVPLIDDTNGVTISVALPLYLACEMANEDGMQTVLYGLGTEELFAGYERHKRVNADDLNRACRAGLMGMHERDLYRDDVVAHALGISLRAPFLAPELVDYALKIPAAYKLSNGENKVILRAIAMELGLEKVARRKKRAVQYGSNMTKAIEKLAKGRGYRYTRDYLRTFYPSRAMWGSAPRPRKPCKGLKLGCLFSSGKDSTFALWLMQKAGYPIECLITIKSRNPASYMFHTPAVELVELQAEAIGVPLIMRETEGEKEKELEDLRAALREAKVRYRIEGVITGALWSTYQKERIERIAADENLKVFAPLWHMNQETELRLTVSNFEVIFTSISAYGLDKSWLGRKITPEDIDRLVDLDRRLMRYRDRPVRRFAGLNIAGEGGEFESLVLDGPLFKKKLVIMESEIIEEDANTARLVVQEAKLEEKRI
ncbi:MAG: diphthine--ammonia ligase [Methanophagales archaeon ANME-1-THS]|nr:MAG: diphthine--ammonia ligase [Methanophagales archaeon ANME-1-THS]